MKKLLTGILGLTLLTACSTEDFEETDTISERSFTPDLEFDDFDCSYDSELDTITCEGPDPEGFMPYPKCAVDYEHPDKVIGHCTYKDKRYTLHCKKDGSSCTKPKF